MQVPIISAFVFQFLIRLILLQTTRFLPRLNLLQTTRFPPQLQICPQIYVSEVFIVTSIIKCKQWAN